MKSRRVEDQLNSRGRKRENDGRLYLQDSNDFIHYHQDPDHCDSEPDEAQADSSRMSRVVEESIREGRKEESEAQGEERLVPLEFVRCDARTETIVSPRQSTM